MRGSRKEAGVHRSSVFQSALSLAYGIPPCSYAHLTPDCSRSHTTQSVELWNSRGVYSGRLFRMWMAVRRSTAVAGAEISSAVVRLTDGALVAVTSSVPPTLQHFAYRRPRRPAVVSSVESAALLNGTACTGPASRTLYPALPSAMGDLFSISILQILSVISFVTSILAVLRVGSVSLHRLSHKFEADVARPAPEMAVGNPAKWNWSLSGLPVSFSIGTLIGEDEGEEHENGMGGYTGGTDLVRMDWQISRPRTGMSAPRYRSCAHPILAPQYKCTLNTHNHQYLWPSSSCRDTLVCFHRRFYRSLKFFIDTGTTKICSSTSASARHCTTHDPFTPRSLCSLTSSLWKSLMSLTTISYEHAA